MKRFALTAAAFAAALFLSSSFAHADTYYDFSFTGYDVLSGSGGTFSGTGVFDTVTTATPGQLQIVGISGTADGSTITGLMSIGQFPTGIGQTPNDNILLYPPQGIFNGIYFTDGGVSFTLANGDEINLNDTFLENAVLGPTKPYTTELDTVTVSPAPAPEPASLALLGTGVLGLAGTIRRRLAS